MTQDPIDILIATSYLLYDSQLVGTTAQSTRERFERMTHPLPGDLVLETSTHHAWLRNPGRWRPHSRIGWLIRTAMEQVPGSEEDPIEEAATYIRLFDGSEFRWTNANFVAISPPVTLPTDFDLPSA